MTGDDQRLRALLDREAIRELAIRYASGVWRKDVAAVAGLFAADGVMDTGTGEPMRGPEAIRAGYERTFASDDFYPFIHNHVIELDVDNARGWCDLELRAVMNGRRMEGFGSYEDRYVRTPAGWKFASRTLVMRELRAAPSDSQTSSERRSGQ
jgi:ketosteroid isomerase-like protein